MTGLIAAGFYVDRKAALEALPARSRFNAIAADAEKIDFIIRRDRLFSVQEFSRRQPADLLGTPGFIASVEDTIIARLEWAAKTAPERQLRFRRPGDRSRIRAVLAELEEVAVGIAKEAAGFAPVADRRGQERAATGG